MSRHLIAVCDRCCSIFSPQRFDSFSYINIEMKDGIQCKLHAEWCIGCAVEFHNILQEYFREKIFTSRADVSISNEIKKCGTVVKVGNVRLGEDIDK